MRAELLSANADTHARLVGVCCVLTVLGFCVRCRYDTVIEGVGIDRVTANLKHARIDDAFRVTDQEAVCMAR